MRLIDLSHVLNVETPVYPGDNPTEITSCKNLKEHSCNTYLFQASLHTGSHVDMPMHMTADSRTADAFPLEHFYGNGVLLDVRGEDPIGMKPEYRERIAPGDVVLLYTGWDRHYKSDPEAYFRRHPVMDPELARFLGERGIRMLGMDIPAPDQFPYEIHLELMNRDVFILENLTNLGALAGVRKFEVFALPLKIGAEASPVRAVARPLEE